MISITVERGPHNRVLGFTARNHGASHVCAAVSLLMINTVNSIEKFTGDAVTCEYNEDGGYIKLAFNGEPGPEAALLTNAMMLGLHGVLSRYPQEINITEKEVQI
jgi:hypothetical protein